MSKTFFESVAEAMDWSVEEAQNFMSCFTAKSEEQLMDDIEAACEWARKVEMQAAMIDIMKKMPPRTIEAKWEDGQIAMRIAEMGEE
jgi:DNA-directed RNA polymerase subunit F